MKIKQFDEFGILLGCAANAVPNVKTLKSFADVMQKLGYNSLYLETADTYKIENEPYFGYMRGGYTKEEIREMDAYCKNLGIELVPCIQTLAHLHFLKYYEDYRDAIDVNDILLVDEERTYVLIENMFRAISEMYSTRRINIGMDEAYLLGAGKYLYKHGYKERVTILLEHLQKVIKIAEKYGFSCEIWSDVFFNALSKGRAYETEKDERYDVPEDWRERLPENLTLVYWEYFVSEPKQCEDMIAMHREISPNIKYAGTFFRWYGLTPNNAYTNKVMKKALIGCENAGVKNVIFTLWADYGGGSSLFATLPSMWYLSRFAANGLKDDGIDFSEFERLFGIDYKTFALLDTVNLPYTDFATKAVSDKRLNNKSFFYMYNDIMYGTLDSLLSDGISVAFKNVAKELGKIKAGKYAYVFDTLCSLADFLSVKAELGKRLYGAYKVKDKAELRKISEDLSAAKEKLETLLNCYEAQYLTENKPFGFENVCIRVGGLKERLSYAKRTLDNYLSGKLEKIAELEEKHLPFGYQTDVGEDNYNVTRYDLIAAHGFI